MTLGPIDVQQKTFGTALRGYDLDEVDDFLDEVVTSLREYEERLAEANARIRKLEDEADERGDAEGAISRALVAAQRSADEIVTEAREEAERILADARQEAGTLEAERERVRAQVAAEIEELRTVVAELRSRVASLSASVEEDLSTMAAAVDEAADHVEPEIPSGFGDYATEVEGRVDVEAVEVEPAEPEIEELGEAAGDETEMEEAEDTDDLEDVMEFFEDTGVDEEPAEAEATHAPRPWERD